MDIFSYNAAHWHTIICHLPLFNLGFAFVLLLLATALKDGKFQRVALILVILTAFLTHFTAELGEDSEDIVKNLPGVEQQYIEDHEEAAEVAIGLMYGLGAIALIILLTTFKQKVISGKVILVMAVLTLGVTGWIAYVNRVGGEINHPENRPTFIGPDNWINGGDSSYDTDDDDEYKADEEDDE